MEIAAAIFSVRSKKLNFYVSAFKHRLIFGPVSSKQVYEELKCFEIDYSDYHQLYIGFFPIIKFLSGKSDINEGTFLEKKCFSYTWKVSKQTTEAEISFFISNTEDLTNLTNRFSIAFSLNEFNDLIYLLTELCFLSLDLNFENLTIFMKLSNFELSKLLTFQNKTTLKTELLQIKNDVNLSELKFHCSCELVFYNLDVIICIHKLRSIFNHNNFITQLNIQALEECEK